MGDAAHFTLRPPFRCFGQRADRPGRPCGALAAWMRPSSHGGETAFFCDACRRPDDVPIADDVPFRRLTLTCDFVLCATSLVDRTARVEALARLEELALAAGGLLNLHAVVSAVGRCQPPAGPGRQDGRGGVSG